MLLGAALVGPMTRLSLQELTAGFCLTYFCLIKQRKQYARVQSGLVAGLILLSTLLLMPVTEAQAAPPGNPINLNLVSKVHNLTAGNLTNSGPVPIKVGNYVLNVTATTPLTPAERLAVYQVFSTGEPQTIILRKGGNATGGTLTLGANFSQYVSGLVIPAGVTAIRDFGATSPLVLTGDFVDSGAFVASSSNSGVTTAAITADHIFLNSSATLSTTGSISALALTGLSSVSNATTISAQQVTINTPSLTNTGSIIASGAGNSINVQSTAGLAIGGNGRFSLTGGGAGSINLIANGANALAFAGNQTFNPGTTGSVSFISQNLQGSVTFAAGVQETVTGGAPLNITTPQLSFLGHPVNITATGPSVITIDEGGALTPLTISSLDGGTVTISTNGGMIEFKPSAGENVVFDSTGGQGRSWLNLVGGPVFIDAEAANINVDPKFRLSSSSSITLDVDPSQYVGVAFQPYVGAQPDGTADSFNALSYSDVLTLLQDLKAQGITQISTYGNGYTGYASPPNQQGSSNQYILQAAKAAGMTVVAGAVQWLDASQPSGWNLTVTEQDITSTLAFAQANPGVVTALNITNEAIEASPANAQNATNILTLVNYAVSQLANYGFQNTTPGQANYMPISIRESAGVLDAVNQGQSYSATLKTILQTVNFVYANVYPYGFNYTLGATPTQQAFQSYVTTQMSSLYSTMQGDFTAQSLTTPIRIGETGWPTAGANTLSPPTPTSVQLAQWDYQAVYNWAQTNAVQTFVFEACNEPFKSASPPPAAGSDQANFGIFIANGQVPTADFPYNQTNNYQLNSVTQQYNLTGLGAGLLVNTSAIQNAGSIIAKTINLNTALLNNSGQLLGTVKNTTPINFQGEPEQEQLSDEDVVSTADVMADE